jgi:hypothetical protein
LIPKCRVKRKFAPDFVPIEEPKSSAARFAPGRFLPTYDPQRRAIKPLRGAAQQIPQRFYVAPQGVICEFVLAYGQGFHS